MFGLEFSAPALINAVVGGAIGAAATLVVGWWSTREIRSDLQKNVDVLVTVARGLEEAFRSGTLEFNYDDEGRPTGIVVHLSATLEGRGSMSADLSTSEDDEPDVDEEAEDLEDSRKLDDDSEIARDRPEEEQQDD